MEYSLNAVSATKGLISIMLTDRILLSNQMLKMSANAIQSQLAKSSALVALWANERVYFF